MLLVIFRLGGVAGRALAFATLHLDDVVASSSVQLRIGEDGEGEDTNTTHIIIMMRLKLNILICVIVVLITYMYNTYDKRRLAF